jgi:hypothetical protein
MQKIVGVEVACRWLVRWDSSDPNAVKMLHPSNSGPLVGCSGLARVTEGVLVLSWPVVQ